MRNLNYKVKFLNFIGYHTIVQTFMNVFFTYELTKEAGVLLPHIGSDAVFALRIIAGEKEEKYRERIKEY